MEGTVITSHPECNGALGFFSENPLVKGCRADYLMNISSLCDGVCMCPGPFLNVSRINCECMDVMLGADSDHQSQTCDQPQVARKGAID